MCTPLLPALQETDRRISEFKAGLVYRVEFQDRLQKLQRNPVKTKPNKQTKNRKRKNKV